MAPDDAVHTGEPLPPTVLGHAGLTGRPQLPLRPGDLDLEEPDGYDERTGEPIWGTARAPGKAIPANCLRRLNSPLSSECTGCNGAQRDGGCLVDIVRRANAQGVDWKFEVVPDGDTVWWDYVGPPLADDSDVAAAAVEERPSFTCPHCRSVNVQDPENFHYWCGACGKNAKDPG